MIFSVSSDSSARLLRTTRRRCRSSTGGGGGGVCGSSSKPAVRARGPLSTGGGARASPLPAVVCGPRRPSDVVACLAAPRSGREDADLAQKQRTPAVGQQHVHQVSGSRCGASPAPPYPLRDPRGPQLFQLWISLYNSEVSGSQD